MAKIRSKRERSETEQFQDELSDLIDRYREDGMWLEHIINLLDYQIQELKAEEGY